MNARGERLAWACLYLFDLHSNPLWGRYFGPLGRFNYFQIKGTLRYEVFLSKIEIRIFLYYLVENHLKGKMA